MKKVFIACLTVLTLAGCTSNVKTDTIEGTATDFTVKAKFEDGVLVYLNENGDEFSKEDLEGTQNHLIYMAKEMDTEPMLYYIEALNKTFNEIDGELIVNGKAYQNERKKLFEEAYQAESCSYALNNNNVSVVIKEKDDEGIVKKVDIEFSSPIHEDETEKQRLTLSYLNMLNSMFGEGAFAIEDLQGTETEQTYKVVVNLTSDLLANKGLEQIDVVDLVNSLKLNEFECK